MDNAFVIPITYKSVKYNFPAELISYGYSYKIEVDVFGTIISFEPDEERNFRALIRPVDFPHRESIDPALIESIAHKLILDFKA